MLFSREAERCRIVLQNSYKTISSISWWDVSQIRRSAYLQDEVKVQRSKCIMGLLFLSFSFDVYPCFPGGSDGKESVYNAGDEGSIPGSGRSRGEGNGKPLQYSCLENPRTGAWKAAVHGVRQSWTRLRHTHMVYVCARMLSSEGRTLDTFCFGKQLSHKRDWIIWFQRITYVWC